MRLLDLYCGAGLAADGYAALGFEITGVDIRPQPHYPYEFIQGDALEYLRTTDLSQYDIIHASPPCQLFTRAKHLRTAQGSKAKEKIDLLTPTLSVLADLPIPWVVENVEGAKSIMPSDSVRLCGSYFRLDVQRHRLFASNMEIIGTPCEHWRFPIDRESLRPRPWGVYHVPGDSIPKGGRTARDAAHAQELMGVERNLPWDSLKEGFPPAYTSWIGAWIITNHYLGG
jgi:DNA (cytosine-5)-methyltransferase 1